MYAAGPYPISFNGESGGYFVWKEYGLEIYFPSRCSQQHDQVTVSVFLPIKNEVYPGAYIVSAVYQFNCDTERFDKAFTLHLQHWVELQSPEDCQKMCFVVVQDGRSDVKYGHFEVGKSYGTITLDRFCHVFIVWAYRLWRMVVQPFSEAVLSISSMITTTTPPYKYEAMISLPRDHHSLTNWRSYYSIYYDSAAWRQVCS